MQTSTDNGMGMGMDTFTFHPGSMQTVACVPSYQSECPIVYIPPWFNADLRFVGDARLRIRGLHSTLVQCRRYGYTA